MSAQLHLTSLSLRRARIAAKEQDESAASSEIELLLSKQAQQLKQELITTQQELITSRETLQESLQVNQVRAGPSVYPGTFFPP